MATLFNALVVFVLAYYALIAPGFLASRSMNRKVEDSKRYVARMFAAVLAAASFKYPAPFSTLEVIWLAALVLGFGCYVSIATTLIMRVERTEYDIRNVFFYSLETAMFLVLFVGANYVSR
ncbi:MAG: hypothetical protein IT290_06390 [Deltaproteobacteria bacterium]|nr:hypothetical protein [Deltaproteobacteria bacterium]